MKRFKAITTLSLIVIFGLSACATDEFGNRRPLTDAEKGALFGAAAGAVVGGAASKKKNRSRGVLLGAVGGGIAGGLVGNYMDNQKKDLELALAPERNAGAIQVEKLQNNILRVTMTEQSAFAVDSSEVKGTDHRRPHRQHRLAAAQPAAVRAARPGGQQLLSAEERECAAAGCLWPRPFRAPRLQCHGRRPRPESARGNLYRTGDCRTARLNVVCPASVHTTADTGHRVFIPPGSVPPGGQPGVTRP
jgi:hypothetical protein